MKIFFSVGEPSGDLHGSNLIRALRSRQPDIECIGFGGPKMVAAGARLHEDLTRQAIMGIWRIASAIPTLLLLLLRADRIFRHERPDAVVLIDFPGFNWWIAWRAKQRRIPVIYYGTPQLWAWAPWRTKKMRRLTDHVLCKLPFEQDWFRQRGVHATYVGHPYFDQLASQSLDQQFLNHQRDHTRPLVVILPGSRTQEIKLNLVWFLKATEHIRAKIPTARFVVASYNKKQSVLADEICRQQGISMEIFHGRTQELMELADCCMACSGSVSLELLYRTKPTVIYYRISRFVYYLLKLFLTVRYITLVNILSDPQPLQPTRQPSGPASPTANRALMPEYPTYLDKSEQMAQHVIRWLTDKDEHRQLTEKMNRLKDRICAPGASQRSADYILDVLHAANRNLPSTSATVSDELDKAA